MYFFDIDEFLFLLTIMFKVLLKAIENEDYVIIKGFTGIDPSLEASIICIGVEAMNRTTIYRQQDAHSCTWRLKRGTKV